MDRVCGIWAHDQHVLPYRPRCVLRSPVSASPKIKKVCYHGSAINVQMISLRVDLAIYIVSPCPIQSVVLSRRNAVKAGVEECMGDKAGIVVA